MANGIRTGDPHGFNQSSVKVPRVRQTPEGRRTYRPKRCGNSNKDEDNSPKTLNDKISLTLYTLYGQLDYDQLNIYRLYNSSVPIQDIPLKTCRKQWTIEKGGEKESGRSMLAARHDDDDEIYTIVYN